MRCARRFVEQKMMTRPLENVLAHRAQRIASFCFRSSSPFIRMISCQNTLCFYMQGTDGFVPERGSLGHDRSDRLQF